MERNKTALMAITVALALAMAAVALWAPVRGLASAGSHVLRAQKFTAVQFSRPDYEHLEAVLDKLRSAAKRVELSDLGTPGIIQPPQNKVLSSLDEAEELLGYRPLVPGFLPEGMPYVPTLRGYTAGTATISLKVSQIRQFLADAGVGNIQLPDSYDGARVTLDTWPALVASYEDPENMLFLAVAQTRPPALAVDGRIDLEGLREQVLASGLVSEAVARQLRSVDDWTITLPVPVPEGGTSKTLELRGTTVLLVSGPQGQEHLALWYERGTVVSLLTNAPEDETIRVIESLH